MVKVIRVKMTEIEPDPLQPRKEFSVDGLAELAESMKTCGLLQPITVRSWNGRYMVIVGERRFRAAQLLGWETIPCLLRDVTDEDVRRLQLLENVTRRDLNVVEEAQAYLRLIEDGHTSKDISAIVGKGADTITWLVHILGCRAEILHLVARGQMKPTLAWHLSRLSYNGQMMALNKIQLRAVGVAEAVMICEQYYMMECQSEAFTETKRTEQEQKIARSVTDAFDKACKAFVALQHQETELSGIVGQAMSTQVDLTLQKIMLLRTQLNWLEKTLKRRRVTLFERGEWFCT